MNTVCCVPIVIVAGARRPWIAAAGSQRRAERACTVLAKSFREVRLVRHPIGKPEVTEELAAWRDGRRVS